MDTHCPGSWRGTYFITILCFLGEITGETFFYQQEHGNLVLRCNQPATTENKRIHWYKTEDNMLQFRLINCSSQCTHLCPETVCSDTLEVTHNLSQVAVFACGAIPGSEAPLASLLFSNASHCRHYSFFLAQTNTASENKRSDNVQKKSQASLTFKERDNITLTCDFHTSNPGQNFFMYWIRVGKTSECLFSATTEDLSPNLAIKQHCCIAQDIEGRLFTTEDFNSAHKSLSMTIANTTSADSGQYLCVVAVWQHGRYEWHVASNWTVAAQRDTAAAMQWYIISGAVAGIIFLCIIVGLIYLKTLKSKGKKTTTQFTRDRDAVGMTEYECSPYAVSSSNDLYRMETLYSSTTGTSTEPNGTSSSPEDSRAPGPGQEVDIYTVYALLNK